MLVDIKKLFSRGNVSLIISNLIDILGAPVAVQAADGTFLIGDSSSILQDKYNIELSGEVIGWVMGGEGASHVADVLNHLASKEYEKKTLARETLERYKELTLLYEITEKIASSLPRNVTLALFG